MSELRCRDGKRKVYIVYAKQGGERYGGCGICLLLFRADIRLGFRWYRFVEGE